VFCIPVVKFFLIQKMRLDQNTQTYTQNSAVYIFTILSYFNLCTLVLASNKLQKQAKCLEV
jgi:hypothetical protein